MQFDGVVGLQSISIQLGGSWTLSSLGQRLGFTWPLASGLCSISNLTVVYVTSPASLAVAMVVSIPSLGLDSVNANLVISPGPQLSIVVRHLVLFGQTECTA